MTYLQDIYLQLQNKHPEQTEFLQATKRILQCLEPIFKEDDTYLESQVLERLLVPERQIIFRVAWQDDHGKTQVNQGFRVQFNSALGPYKGGLRFHPSVNLSIMKFLGYEQSFKNALSGLAIGGAKGGSDFDPSNKSDHEIMRFCQAFMNELYHYIGPTQDIPAGDIGVGAKEIGYLFGQYKRLTHRYEGVLTGKKILWSGSLGRTEATGYGNVYFANEMLKAQNKSLEGKICLVSGAGNVSIYTIEKLLDLGAIPVSCCDSKGFLYDKSGINLTTLKYLKEENSNSLEDYLKTHPEAVYTAYTDAMDNNPMWTIPCDLAFPCATQNELLKIDAQNLLNNGCQLVSEGANMPCSAEAIDLFLKAGILYAPGKASNAGGVATSQLEMAQNASMCAWSFEQVDTQLKKIMQNIYYNAANTAKEYGFKNNLVIGSNIYAFKKIANAMIEQGIY